MERPVKPSIGSPGNSTRMKACSLDLDHHADQEGLLFRTTRTKLSQRRASFIQLSHAKVFKHADTDTEQVALFELDASFQSRVFDVL